MVFSLLWDVVLPHDWWRDGVGQTTHCSFPLVINEVSCGSHLETLQIPSLLPTNYSHLYFSTFTCSKGISWFHRSSHLSTEIPLENQGIPSPHIFVYTVTYVCHNGLIKLCDLWVKTHCHWVPRILIDIRCPSIQSKYISEKVCNWTHSCRQHQKQDTADPNVPACLHHYTPVTY